MRIEFLPWSLWSNKMKLIFYENQFIQQQTTYHIQYLYMGIEEKVYIMQKIY